MTEAAIWRCSIQKVFLESLQNSQESTCDRVSLLKKRLWHRCFLANFTKFLRTPFFTEHFRWLLLKSFFLKKVCKYTIKPPQISTSALLLPKTGKTTKKQLFSLISKSLVIGTFALLSIFNGKVNKMVF